MKRAEKKDHLISVAAHLFNQAGYHGTGIDQVLAESGVAKTTLYRHFSSKEELIVAALQKIDQQYREDLRASVDAAANSPREKLLATFDFLEAWFKQKTFHGCPFVSAAAEYSDRSSPVFQEAKLHKRLLVAYFEELARAAELPHAAALAEQINLLHEGAITVAHVTGQASSARLAKSMASRLMGSARDS